MTPPSESCPSPGTLYLADPSLRDRRGHHYQLALAVSAGARQAGRRVVWLAHQDADPELAAAGVEVRRVFRQSMYEAFTPAVAPQGSRLARVRDRIVASSHPLARGLIGVYRGLGLSRDPARAERGRRALDDGPEALFADDLRRGLQSGAGPHDTVLLPTADGITYRAVLRLVTRDPAFVADAPALHLVTPYDVDIMPHARRGLPVDRVIFYLTRLGVLERRVFLHAENALLAEALSRRWGVPLGTLDLPPPAVPDDVPDPSGPMPAAAADLTVTYLGAAREEKGFCWLPDIVRRVRAQVAPGRVRFFVQCSPQVLGYTPATQRALDELRSMESSDLELCDQPLGSAEYLARLRSSDVVLMPYQPDRYRVRGSGIAVEAVASGCVILSTPGTFPAYVGAECACTADTAQGFAHALLDVLAARDSWRQRASERAGRYLSEHSALRYVERLVTAGTWSPGAGQPGSGNGGAPVRVPWRRLVSPGNSY